MSCLPYKIFVYKSYVFNKYVEKQDFACKEIQNLIYQKTRPNNQLTNKQTNSFVLIWFDF